VDEREAREATEKTEAVSSAPRMVSSCSGVAPKKSSYSLSASAVEDTSPLSAALVEEEKMLPEPTAYAAPQTAEAPYDTPDQRFPRTPFDSALSVASSFELRVKSIANAQRLS